PAGTHTFLAQPQVSKIAVSCPDCSRGLLLLGDLCARGPVRRCGRQLTVVGRGREASISAPQALENGVRRARVALLGDDPGAPVWWPSFCLAYDVTAAAYLAWLLASKRVRAYAARQ